MCSIVEDDFAEEPAHIMPADEKPPIAFGVCQKCKEKDAVLKLKFKEEQCQNCFEIYVRHKFRKTLGATKILKRDSKVLFYLTGLKENVCLLDMVKFGLEQEAHKRLVFDMELLFVDEFLFRKDYNEESHLEYIGKIREISEKYARFKLFYCPLNFTPKFLEFDKVNVDTLRKFRKENEKFAQTLNSAKNPTSRQDFLEESKRNLLYKVAQQLNCSFVFLSEISIDLAKKLISNIALGRGGTASLDVGFCDDRVKEIRFIRPLRELDIEEVDYYMKFNQISFLEANLEEDSSQSIQNLASSFIDGLQENFSSTISSVFRTGDKLAASKSNLDSKLENLKISNTICKFCNGKLDVFDSKTLPAIEYSRLVSKNANSFDENRLKEIMGKAEESVISGKSLVQSQLCHSCRNIFEDVEGSDEFLMEMFEK